MKARRALGWVALAGLVTAALAFPAPPRPAAPLLRRLLGPAASLVAEVQWVRAHRALREGRLELALARAEGALALDPGATGGWQLAASWLAQDRAAREPDPARRLAWIRAGLQLAERGQATAREPGELAFLRGLILALRAGPDAELPWPGGPGQPWREAAAAFRDAERAGHAGARAFAESAEAEAAQHPPAEDLPAADNR